MNTVKDIVLESPEITLESREIGFEVEAATVRVAWVSRHPLGAEQLADLADRLAIPAERIQVKQLNITFSCSRNGAIDQAKNAKQLTELFDKFDYVTGVFPPVAIEALGLRQVVYTPVSEQVQSERADGSKQIAFQHLRWSRLQGSL